MKVDFQPRIYNKVPNKNVSFGSLSFCINSYRDINGIVRETQNTTEKRADLDYRKLAAIMETRFCNFNHVNIMPMNTSDATELYYISDAIIETCGFERFKSRYTPILATDVCEEVINKYPMREIVYLKQNEFSELSRIVEAEDISKYKDLCPTPQYWYHDYYKLYRIKEEYKRLFNFGVCDFQERLKNMKDEGNSVVIIRNCLRQSFGDIESVNIIAKLDKILTGASLFITGNFDRVHMPFFMDILQTRFKEITHNVWGKKDYIHMLKK